MQSQNPELVNQLREQMGRPPTDPSTDNEPGSTDPKPGEQPPPGPGILISDIVYL